MATKLHVSADAGEECIRPLRDLVANVALAEGLSSTQVYAVKLCVSEALTNAVKHAFPESASGPLDVFVREVGDKLAVVVADHGRAHRPWRWKDHGGFGLAFVYRLTDGCTFTAASSGTKVEMLFPLPQRRVVKRRPVRRQPELRLAAPSTRTQDSSSRS
jgi:two-component sensor histidine kinase